MDSEREYPDLADISEVLEIVVELLPFMSFPFVEISGHLQLFPGNQDFRSSLFS
jgi:hypothetical protein